MNIQIKKRYSEEEELELKNVLEEESVSYLPSKKRRFYQKLFSKIKWRARELRFSIKYGTQRFFRPLHLSNMDLWNFQYTMAKWIYPRLKKFIAMERHGYPGIFSEYNENEWDDRESYNEAIAKGTHLGGEEEAWEETLNEILFAFEWMLHFEFYENEAQRDDFCKKWNIKNPYEKNLENKTISYEYRFLDNGGLCWSSEPDLDKKYSNYIFFRRVVSYHNVDLVVEFQERAQKGFEMFGKHFLSFWD